MQGWWRRDPFFVRYMVREATAVAVLVYAVVLTVGAVRLAQGEAAWNGWLAALRSPGSVLLHVVLLVAMVVHAKSWFEIMPKTMPMIVIGGRRLSATTITRSGWAAAVIASIALFAWAAWWRA
jgi:fumarate reductase subunit C